MGRRHQNKMESCLFESELEIDKLKSDIDAEQKAVEKLQQKISDCDQTTLQLEEKKTQCQNEILNYEKEHSKLQSINDQLRSNAESVKKLRDELKRKLARLTEQWAKEKHERKSILETQKSAMCVKLSQGSKKVKDNVLDMDQGKKMLLEKIEQKFNFSKEIMQQICKQFESNKLLPFSDLSSFTQFIINMNSNSVKSEKDPQNKKYPTTDQKHQQQQQQYQNFDERSSSKLITTNVSSSSTGESNEESFCEELKQSNNDASKQFDFKEDSQNLFEKSSENFYEFKTPQQQKKDPAPGGEQSAQNVDKFDSNCFSLNLFDNTEDTIREDAQNRFEMEMGDMNKSNVVDVSFDTFNFSFEDTAGNLLNSQDDHQLTSSKDAEKTPESSVMLF